MSLNFFSLSHKNNPLNSTPLLGQNNRGKDIEEG